MVECDKSLPSNAYLYFIYSILVFILLSQCLVVSTLLLVLGPTLWQSMMGVSNSVARSRAAQTWASARGNIMYWKVHKVGSSTLREILVRRARAHNMTVSTLGCVHQRPPAVAHISASHVVCREPAARREAALNALLGTQRVEVVLLRSPAERALSGLYYIGMSDKRTAALAASECAFNVSFMTRSLGAELLGSRREFASHGLAALQACAAAGPSSGRNAAHVRVFLPQWGYWASTLEEALQHLQNAAAADRFFVGLHEHYDESLVLLAHWLGWKARAAHADNASASFQPLPTPQTGDMKYHWRKKAFQHPRVEDWSEADRKALAEASEASGEAAFFAAAQEVYAEQVERYGGSAALAAEVAILQALNAEGEVHRSERYRRPPLRNRTRPALPLPPPRRQS